MCFLCARLLRTPGPLYRGAAHDGDHEPDIILEILKMILSYRFHSERLPLSRESMFKFDSFLQALGGQLLYSNPVNVVLIIIAPHQVRFWFNGRAFPCGKRAAY